MFGWAEPGPTAMHRRDALIGVTDERPAERKMEDNEMEMLVSFDKAGVCVCVCLRVCVCV